MMPLLGTQIGRYHISRHLASGGMGAVYEARHEQLSSRVAVKVMHADSLHNPNARARFNNEAIAASLVEHPHVVQIYEMGELSDGLPYLIMNFLPGMTLAAYLQQLRAIGGRPDICTVLDIGSQIASALVAVHEKGIVHRDIKPGNIILVSLSSESYGGAQSRQRHCVLIDFGIAKLPDRVNPDLPPLTRPGQGMGTEHYMAPEQAADAASAEPAADIYALGVVLRELLSARPPPPTGRSLEIRAGATSSHPGLSLPERDEELAGLVEQMMDESPSRRPEAAYVEQTLRRLASGKQRASIAATANSFTNQRVSISPYRRWPRAAALFSLGLALGALGTYGGLARSRISRPATEPPLSARAMLKGRRWLPVAVQRPMQSGATNDPLANLSGIWGSAADDIWIVGRQRGTLLHYDGGKLQQIPDEDGRAKYQFYGLWGTDRRNIWAVGSGGAILRYDGAWRETPIVAAQDLKAISGSGPTEVLAVGRGVILRFDANQWSPIKYNEPYDLHGIWFTSPGDAWIVGYNDLNSGVTLRWDGHLVKTVSKNDMRMRDIWGDDKGQIWAVATLASPVSGNILRWEGSDWKIVKQIPGKWLTTIRGNGPDDIWVTGESSLIHFDGQSWSDFSDSVPQKHYRGLWGSRGNMWAVGEQGTVLRLADWEPAAVESHTDQNLHSIWGSSEHEVWAVGGGGSILRYDGREWHPQTSITQQGLNSVHGCNQNTVFSVGDAGVSLVFDGSRWRPAATGTNERLSGVHCQDGVAVAVGDSGAVLAFQDGAWQRIQNPSQGDLRAVWGSLRNELWLVGRRGLVLHFKNGHPEQLPSPSLEYLSVWSSEPGQAWAAADDGTVVRFQSGAAAQPMRPVASALHALHGTSPGDLWAAGTGGALVHFDGQAWRTLRSGTKNGIRAIWGTPHAGIFLVGERGGIWH